MAISLFKLISGLGECFYPNPSGTSQFIRGGRRSSLKTIGFPVEELLPTNKLTDAGRI